MKILNTLKTRAVINSLMTFVFIVLFSACADDAPVVQLPPTISSYEPSAAFVEQTITINGTNFGTSIEDVEVTFYDGAIAEVESVTATAITVIVPTDAYVGPVEVKVKALSTTGSEFTVNAMCSRWVGEFLYPYPCPRIKSGEGPK